MQANDTVYVSPWFSSDYLEEVDIDINLNCPFSNDVNSSNSYIVQNCITHEIGHLLGLHDLYDSTYTSEYTMYGATAKGETKKCTLEQDDKNGIIYIYN